MNDSKKDYRDRRTILASLPVEQLLRLLESDDLRTRFLAEMCLRDATGT